MTWRIDACAARKPTSRVAQQPARAAVMMGLGGGQQMHEGGDPLILATIGQRYRFVLLHPGQPLELEPQITLGPKGGMPQRLHRHTPARGAA
jgi:hypothetical protein